MTQQLQSPSQELLKEQRKNSTMEDSDTSLLCQETVYTLNMDEEEDVDKENIGLGCAPIWFSEDEGEYIENLIRREAVHERGGSGSRSSPFGHLMESNLWWRQARMDSIEWILSVSLYFPLSLLHFTERCSVDGHSALAQ